MPLRTYTRIGIFAGMRFDLLAEPARRDILDLLLQRPHQVARDHRHLGPPAWHQQTPARPASSRPRHRPQRCPTPLVRTMPPAPRRDRCLAHPLPPPVEHHPRPPRTAPRHHGRPHPMNETLTLHPDGRTTLRMQRHLSHPQDKVWQAITRPEHLSAWFPADVTIDGDRSATASAPTAAFTENDPPHTFAHTWGDDELRWHLHPHPGGGTVLTFTHIFSDHHGAASFAAGWHTCLKTLLAQLDGRPTRLPKDPTRPAPPACTRTTSPSSACAPPPTTATPSVSNASSPAPPKTSGNSSTAPPPPPVRRHPPRSPSPASTRARSRALRAPSSWSTTPPRAASRSGVHRGHRPGPPVHRHPHRRGHRLPRTPGASASKTWRPPSSNERVFYSDRPDIAHATATAARSASVRDHHVRPRRCMRGHDPPAVKRSRYAAGVTPKRCLNSRWSVSTEPSPTAFAMVLSPLPVWRRCRAAASRRTDST